MSTIRVRRLDTNWDPAFGGGQRDYITDVDAVMQIIKSWLKLWLAEWWEDQTEGLPMFQKILGKMRADKDVADRLIQKRIAEVEYVTKIVSFSSTFDPSTRAYSCQVTVDTAFGLIAVTSA